MTNGRMDTKKMVLGGVLTALVIILEVISASLGKAGIFRFTFSLIPIAIGVASCGTAMGAWLGFVFGMSVLLTGDAAAFLAVNAPGTIITVLLKGILCGVAAGIVYNAVKKINSFAAAAAAAIICPIVNTGVFLIGCLIFFMDTVTGWAVGAGFGANVGQYMILGLVGINFLFELGSNIILTPVVARLINISKK